MITIRRVYDPPHPDDGKRVLVDRIWPRGLSKQDAVLACWMKDIAPSTPLRKWFGHDPEKWDAFVERYRRELDENSDAVGKMLALAETGPLTLLYSAKDKTHNNAVVLRGYLEEKLRRNR